MASPLLPDRVGHLLLLGSASINLMQQASKTLAGLCSKLRRARRAHIRAALAGRNRRPTLDDARPCAGNATEPVPARSESRRLIAGSSRSLHRPAGRLAARAKTAAVGRQCRQARLVRTPKTYIRDSELTRALLELETSNDVLSHPIAGTSWENETRRSYGFARHPELGARLS